MNPPLTLFSFLLLLTACADGPAPAPAIGSTPPHRAGRAGFPLPQGWSEARRQGDVVVVNPGFAPDDELTALVIVAAGGELSADERRCALPALLRAQLPQLAEQLADQQIAIDAGHATVASLDLAGDHGAELRAPGTASDQPVDVWIGARRDQTWSGCVIAIVVREQRDRFLPGARTILDGMRFSAPTAVTTAAADGDGAADLAGAEFGRESFGSGTSLTAVYSFAADGEVRRRTMFSSQWNSSDRTDPGTYRCDGDHLAMQVGGDAPSGTLERQGSHVVALHIGGNRYRRL